VGERSLLGAWRYLEPGRPQARHDASVLAGTECVVLTLGVADLQRALASITTGEGGEGVGDSKEAHVQCTG
jgi:hypothetical protein